ncbi:growth arrest-specific protein 8 homolog [Selaginella moellendorffii]|uniref:growth arrest-specific protein 8 homolog n=1 Tax=Selaginella moellendorffii TaxID=88036 RepID=UPI000D1C5EB4|nr:growth arrest-specific protein 8 homolog [Selaginella moellendorffii]|eukprot:XP_024540040.1 growth arrest-specific protein 8 homolog [Selaginella moellendorffii]
MIRQEYDAKAKDLVQSNERKCKKIEEDSELRKKQEVHEIEERKNQHIIELMKKHEKAFADIKFYYNDITQNNLDLIKTLKEDITDMKKKEQANEKFMYEIAQENKHSMEPLTKALKELDVLRKHIQVLEKVQEDKDDLYARFESCIFDVQQKCGLKSMLLEKKLHVVQEQLEKKAHDSIVKAFEVKLAALGIPLQEMGLPYYLSKIQL